jgi:hypothetical protein
MAISKKILDELLKEYKGPDDITGPDGLLKQLTKAVIERATQAETTEQLGYEKGDQVDDALAGLGLGPQSIRDHLRHESTVVIRLFTQKTLQARKNRARVRFLSRDLLFSHLNQLLSTAK